MLNKQKVKCVLIDLDDTLLANARFMQPVFVMRAFWKLRPHVGTVSFFRAMTAMTSAKGGAADMLNHKRFLQAFAEATDLNLPQCESLFEHHLLKVVQSCKAYFAPISPGVEFVKKMAKSLPIVLATNPVLTQECTNLRISWTGLKAEDFLFVTHSQNSHACKPSPRYYEEILKRLEAQGIHKDECVFIGNDPTDDAAAIFTGIATILVRPRAKIFKTIRNDNGRGAALYEASWPLILRHFE